VFWGEFGYSGGKFGGDDDGQLWWASDVPNLHIHNALWASVVSAAAGGPMQWWWHEFDDHDAYLELAPIRRFVDRLPLLARRWASLPLTAHLPPSTTLQAETCNASAARVGFHFPPSQGAVLAHYDGGIASACAQRCCSNVDCDGWIFTTNQTGDFPPCVHGGLCCWLKQGVASLVPQANCTAEIVTRPTRLTLRGRVMVGAPDAGQGQGQGQQGNAITAVGWLYNTAHTWKQQSTTAGKAAVVGVEVDVPGMASGSYMVHVVNTTTGNDITTMTLAVGTDEILPCTLPSFVGDIAFLAERV